VGSPYRTRIGMVISNLKSNLIDKEAYRVRFIWRACLSALPLSGTPLDRLPSHYPTLPGITASPRTLRATPPVVLDRGRQPCETVSRATRRLARHELATNDLKQTKNHLENWCAPLDDTVNKKGNSGFLHLPKGDSSVNQAINNIFSPGHDYAYNTPLADLDVSDPTLWPNQAMWAVFKRLRDEDPLHYCKDGWNSIARGPEDEAVGPYWSVTRYEDIMAIDTDHHRFSSEPFITLQNPAEGLPIAHVHRDGPTKARYSTTNRGPGRRLTQPVENVRADPRANADCAQSNPAQQRI
jgi:hypothetical protein